MMTKKDIATLRKAIDKLNDCLREGLLLRLEVVAAIAEYKAANKLPIEDAKREAQVLKKMTKGLKGEEKEYITAVTKAVFKASKSFQRKVIKVAKAKTK